MILGTKLITNLQADSYGETELDVDGFAKAKLGVKLDRKYEAVYKNSSPRKEMKKATVKPSDTDYMNLPVNFTWADKKNTKCPVYKIRDQANCGSCWVKFKNILYETKVSDGSRNEEHCCS